VAGLRALADIIDCDDINGHIISSDAFPAMQAAISDLNRPRPGDQLAARRAQRPQGTSDRRQIPAAPGPCPPLVGLGPAQSRRSREETPA